MAESKGMLPKSTPNTSNTVARNISLRSILRISMPVSVLLYCAGFHYSYVKWVSPVWAYGGLTYTSPPLALLVIAYAFPALLCAISPLKLQRPSHVLYWMLYFPVYIPGMLVPLFIQLDSGFGLLLLQLSLTGGMALIAISSRLPSLTFRRYPLNPGLFWAVFAIIYLIGNAVMFIVYRNNLHFASIETMYSVRHESGKVVGENPVTGYISQQLANVLNPLLMVYGLANRRKRLILLGILGQIFLYCVFANKLTLLSPIVVVGLYYTIKNDRGGWVPKLSLFLAGVFFCLTTLVIEAKPGALFNITSVVLVRTFAIPGMLIGEYQYFFENQPHTYLGTVNGLNLFVPDPYTLPLGMEVSAFYGNKASENGRANANANLFATDGIAAFGLPGILMAAALCAVLLWVLDGCTSSYPLEVSVSALTMVISSLTNVSIFTTLLGNGLITWMLLFIFIPRYFLSPDIQAHNMRNGV
jgi:hypothetical protein